MKAESHDPADRKTFLSMLKNTTSTDDVRHVEAKAAQEFWRQWIGVQLSFKGPGVSDEWRIFPGRYIGRRQGRLGELASQFTARNAIHPMLIGMFATTHA